MKKYLCLDVGGTNTKYGILTEEGEILLKDKFQTIQDKFEFLKKIRELATEFKNSHNISGIALSLPGIIDIKRGFTVTAGSIPALGNCYLQKELEELTGLPVSMENDVNSVALAEKWLGNGRGVENFICLAIGTGIGGAIIVNDNLYRGQRFMAGEFGYMLGKDILNHNPRPSTLSMIASTQFGIVDAYNSHTGKNLSGEEISSLYKNGDSEARAVFQEFFKYISTGIFNLIFALDPGKVLIGGAISEDSAIVLEIEKQVNEIKNNHYELKHLEMPKIESCKFSNDAGVIGALYHFLKEEKRGI